MKPAIIISATILLSALILAFANRYQHDGNTVMDRFTGNTEYDGLSHLNERR